MGRNDGWMLCAGILMQVPGRDITDAIRRFRELPKEEQARIIREAADRYCDEIARGNNRWRECQ